MTTITWIGIFFCVTQSAMFSGLNLAFFSISKLRLEIESKRRNKEALKVAKLRENSNFLLTTILWGNVGINVLLALLSNSVMAGVTAFVFSTFIITLFGEIAPQAYFSRHALQTAALLSPVLRFYQFLLYPVAKPTALILDKWLGAESVKFFQERDLRELLRMHIDDPETDIEEMEGKGAMNFLAMDDIAIVEEGEVIVPSSIIQLQFMNGKPVFPQISGTCEDPFLQQVQRAGKRWTILADEKGEPRLALESDGFLRAALFEASTFRPLDFCHRPIIIRDPKSLLGEAIIRLKVQPERSGDDVIDEDIILFWGDQKRIITGSDVLGRLLRGIVKLEGKVFRKSG